jgi:hypothetical protein
MPLWLFMGMLPSLIGAAVALWAPEDVLDRLSFLSSLVDVLLKLVPAMPDYVARSQFPQVTLFVFLIAWILFPIQLVYVVYSLMRYGDIENAVRSFRARGVKRWKVLALCAVVSFAFLLSVAFWAKDPTVFGKLGVAGSRVGLALFGAFSFWLGSIAVAMFCVVLLKTNKEDF